MKNLIIAAALSLLVSACAVNVVVCNTGSCNPETSIETVK